MIDDDLKSLTDSHRRYAKQIRFAEIGTAGQDRLAQSRVVIIGCGALGSVSANLLVRSGVGQVLLIDRDFVELDNLQRQVLFDETDLGIPKAVVAAEKLRQVNSDIRIEGQIADVDCHNIEMLLMKPRPADLVIDGTDNFEIRFLINDACVKHGLPWIYAGCLGAEGQVMTVFPQQSACLNCLMLDGPPPVGSGATCDSGGILATIVNVVAAIQVNEGIKYLSGNAPAICARLQVFDLWRNRFQSIDISGLRDQVVCPTCHRGEFRWLSGDRVSQTAILCGRNAVQVSPPNRQPLDLTSLAQRLSKSGQVESNEYLVRLKLGERAISVFSDGRAIIHGTDDLAIARKLYAQFLGH